MAVTNPYWEQKYGIVPSGTNVTNINSGTSVTGSYDPNLLNLAQPLGTETTQAQKDAVNKVITSDGGLSKTTTTSGTGLTGTTNPDTVDFSQGPASYYAKWDQLTPTQQKLVIAKYGPPPNTTSTGAPGSKPTTGGTGYTPPTGTGGTGGTGGGTGVGDPNAPFWDPIGYGPDVMDFNTQAPNPGDVPEFPWFTGDGGPNVTTQTPGADGNTFTQINPDGSVTPGVVDPTTREVQREELVAEQLSDLLRSDSKFIQDARRQGLEQANAVGGLGGTAGVGAAMQAAMRTALPIAQADAEAFRAAASQNMDALNQFAQLNHDRATKLELGQIDARTRQLTTQIATSAQMAAAQLESATQRDLTRLDSETRLRLAEMDGKIQDRLADQAFRYTALLNDAEYAAELAKNQLQGEYGLAGYGVQGQWQSYIQGMTDEAQAEANYLQAATNAYTGYLDRLANLNGQEMDDAARTRAIENITRGAQAQLEFLSKLFPGVDPIAFDW